MVSATQKHKRNRERERSDSVVSLDSILSDMESMSYKRTKRNHFSNSLSPTDIFFTNPIEFGPEVNVHERTSPALPNQNQILSFKNYEIIKKITKGLAIRYIPDLWEIRKISSNSPNINSFLISHMIALFAHVLDTKQYFPAAKFVQNVVNDLHDDTRLHKKCMKEAFGALRVLNTSLFKSELIKPVALKHFDNEERRHTQTQAISHREFILVLPCSNLFLN